MSMRFGIEIEYFIIKSRRAPQVEEVQRLFRFLNKNQKYPIISHSEDGLTLSVSQLFPEGLLTIKTDVCTHILELSFPPLCNTEVFVYLYKHVMEDVRRALRACALILVYGGVLEHKPQTVQFFPSSKQQQERIEALSTRKVPERRFSRQNFLTYMCATQVHLDVDSDNFYAALPCLYEFEYLVPLLFSNSTTMDQANAHCIRPLLYRDSLDENSYLANAFPTLIPTSRESYDQMITSTHNFVRDYSFIRRTPYNTVEFRTCCSLNNETSIIELVALRLCVYQLSHQLPAEAITDDSREHFFNVCLTGQVKREQFFSHLESLGKASKNIPRCFQSSMQALLTRAFLYPLSR